MHVIIIGTGHAGINAASIMRQNSDEIDITMVSEDRFPPYPRPSIYKIILGKSPSQIFRYPENWYDKNNINLLLGHCVIKIRCQKKSILCADQSELKYDKLLIATGSKPFIPPIPGIRDGPLYCLRNIDDALAIREKAERSTTGKATILGGGLLSVELAKTLSDIDIQPTIIDRSPYLLRKQLDPEGGQFLNRLLDKTFDTSFIFNTISEQIIRKNDEEVKIELRDHSGLWTHECDFLCNATGVRNDNTLPRDAGITIGEYAIVVNPFMQTNIPDVYAAGDAVNIDSFPGSKFGIIPTAVDQAKIAAINILGTRVPYTGTLPWTTLKIAGIDLTSIGDIELGPGIEEKGIIRDFQQRIYQKLFFKEDKIQGAILIGSKISVHQIKTLIIHHEKWEVVKNELNLEE